MNLKMSIYRTLTSSAVKKVVRRVENFCSANLPTVYSELFLPAKSFAKSTLLKLTLTSARRTSNSVRLWKSSDKPPENFSPRVSVIVPNFNHEKFLRQRLETIYSQSYTNFEVILLDDASTDASLEILREFFSRHENITRLIVNEKNSGSVFSQWRRGLDAATGDLIWIAESDDYSAENFLAELVPAFADEAVQLAFARSDFIQDGRKISATENYLADIPAFDWTKPFTATAAEFVASAMAVKNVIPNVSGVIFRKPTAFRAELIELWRDMKLCGDWLFYLEIIRGGAVSYNPAATNFYRVHQQSTSLKIQKEYRYYEEHARIAEFIAENYSVPAEIHTRHLLQLEEHFTTYFGGTDKSELAKYFSVEKIQRVARKPNILMCVFSMSIGGGETFPLILANELHRRGCPVTVLDFQMSEDLPKIRAKLNRGIPLVRLSKAASLAEVVDQFKIDILHSHHGAVDEAVTYISAPEIRRVVTLHGMYEATQQPHLKNLLRRVTKSVNAFVYIADKNLQPFTEFGTDTSKNFYKIGNGLERSAINPVPRESLGIPENSFTACVVSRAIPEKGWQAAIDAVTLANKNSSRRIDLVLVGDGEMYDKLKDTAPEFVHLTGFKSNVRDYLAAADIGLLPSEFAGESFPLLIIDSFFSGRPVVSSNLGEVANMLKISTGEMAGITFDLVDGKVPVETLSEILTTLANDAAACEKIAARVAEAAEKFSIERVAEKYIAVYNSVMK